MATHMSIRLAWHNDGWNGHICKSPCENTYCIGRNSYPGDLIAGTRNIEFESSHAGEPCSNHPCRTACGLSVNAFGKDPISVNVDIPSFWDKGSAEAIKLTLPPYTACTWCYEEMYNDSVTAEEGSYQKYNYQKRFEGAQRYFSKFEPGKSLIFYYSGYSNPFSESEENNYVVVGVSRVKEIGQQYFYNNVSERIKEKYAGGFIWQRPITSTYPDEGFCIPYWKYKENDEILSRIVLKPMNRSPFKYGSREVDNDDAIEIINQLIAVVDALIEIGDDTENWEVRKSWLNSVLNELWTARGPYPGFPSVLESLSLGSLISSYVGLSGNAAMKAFRDEVLDFLEGKRDDIAGKSFSAAEARKIRREYKLMEDETVDLLFNTLSRFDLSADQVKAIVSPDRENSCITADIASICENPYIIFEQYVGKDSDDVIPFYKIDNGVIPSPEYGIEELFDPGATERFRAFCVDELKRTAAHSFVNAETILNSINARIDRMPEWKRYVFRMKNYAVDTDILDEALVQREASDGVSYLYLKQTYEDERTVESVLRMMAERPDIRPVKAIVPESFKKHLRKNDSAIARKEPKEYEQILDNQANTCLQIFNKPLCVLSGAAGTGKTTVINSLLGAINSDLGFGASFLMMAPTGKAAERIKVQTEKPSSTIHSYLAKYGWLNDNLTLKRKGGKLGSDYSTIIIDESSMIDLNLFATLFRAINWNSVQRLILVGDPNQLPPIGQGRVFADTIEWLKDEFPDNVGKLTDNVRQRANILDDKGTGILDLAQVFIQENQFTDDAEEADSRKKKKEELFAKILEEGNGDVYQDLGVYFWNEQSDLESLIPHVMADDMRAYLNTEAPYNETAVVKLWRSIIRKNDGTIDPDAFQLISPYRGEFYGADSINLLLQRKLNPGAQSKALDGIGYWDKVIQIRNRPASNPIYAYSTLERKNVIAEIFNGEIGLASAHGLDKEKKNSYIERLQVAFSGPSRQGLRYSYGKNLGKTGNGKEIPAQKVDENLELAYAISVHKSQGSEFDYVYLVLPHRNSHLLSMELLYTALTRAQKKITLFIQQDIGTLTTLSRPEKSAVRRINSSVFRFEPLPEDVIRPTGSWYESRKNIATLSEYYVRSKSEAIITNLLVDRGIPFKYEEPLRSKDGVMYLPDFTVTFRGEDYYWEHVGLIHDESYMAHWEKKKAWYDKHFPGKLLITYESPEISKDAMKVIEDHI